MICNISSMSDTVWLPVKYTNDNRTYVGFRTKTDLNLDLNSNIQNEQQGYWRNG